MKILFFILGLFIGRIFALIIEIIFNKHVNSTNKSKKTVKKNYK